MKHLILTLLLAAFTISTGTLPAATPVISNVWAAQIPGTHQIRIEYDLAADAPCDIKVQYSLDGGASYGTPLSDDLFPEAMRKNVTAGNRATGTQKSLTLTVAETAANGETTVKIQALDHQFTKNLRFMVLATEVDSTFLQAGLVAYYPFEDNVTDASGHARHGTTKGAINFAVGKVGKAASFYQSWIQIPNVLNDLQSFSISLWVNEQGMVYSGPGVPDEGGRAGPMAVRHIFGLAITRPVGLVWLHGVENGPDLALIIWPSRLA